MEQQLSPEEDRKHTECVQAEFSPWLCQERQNNLRGRRKRALQCSSIDCALLPHCIMGYSPTPARPVRFIPAFCFFCSCFSVHVKLQSGDEVVLKATLFSREVFSGLAVCADERTLSENSQGLFEDSAAAGSHAAVRLWQVFTHRDRIDGGKDGKVKE